MYLRALGWDSFFQQHWESTTRFDWKPARVVEAQREAYRIVGEEGEISAEITGRFRHSAANRAAFPVVGDWVAVSGAGVERKASIHEVLPRRTKLSRKVAGDRAEEQVLVANVDIVIIVTSLNGDLNPRRLERYLSVVSDSGAQPVLVLSKADLCPDWREIVADIATVAVGADIHVLSAQTGEGIEVLNAYFGPGRTGVLIGSSGVGKSTLINALIGSDVQATASVRMSDDRGRHGTTYRRLFSMPAGGVLIDTPGIRELQPWDTGRVEETFSDIAALAARCRFSDCRHAAEPGCAVQEAITNGRLDPDRLCNLEKLKVEQDHLDRRRDIAAQSEERKRGKRIAPGPGIVQGESLEAAEAAASRKPKSFIPFCAMTDELIYLVHGSNAHTWWRRLANGGYPWWRRWSLFCLELRRTFGECEIREFRWSGDNTHEARLRAGGDLARAVSEAAGKRRIHVIGHSHGANVAVVAADLLPAGAIETLVLLAHPQMSLVRKPNVAPEWLYWGLAAERVPRIWNLYSPEDRVQCALVRRFHGIPSVSRSAVRVERVFAGPASTRIESAAISWTSRQSAHSAMHSSPLGAVIGSLLGGEGFDGALRVAGLHPDRPNGVMDRGGWPGIQKTQALIAQRGDPSPFEFGADGREVGILFVHGFTASPAELRPMAEFFAKRGWRCRGMVLPGHGTTIEDMERVPGDAWVDAVEQEFDRLAAQCRRVFLVGLSLGATLCCHVASRQKLQPRLRGLILMSPAFGVSWHRTIAVRLLRRALKSRPKNKRATDFFLDHQLYNYVENPLERVADLLRLGKEAVRNLGALQGIPTLLFTGDRESTVSLEKIHNAARANPWIRLTRLPRSRHILPLEPDRQALFEASADFIEERVRS